LSGAPPTAPPPAAPGDPAPVKYKVGPPPPGDDHFRPFTYPVPPVVRVVGDGGAHVTAFSLDLNDSQSASRCNKQPLTAGFAFLRFVTASTPFCANCPDIQVTGGGTLLECPPAWLDILEPASLSPLTPGSWVDQSGRLWMEDNGTMSFETIA